jgi:hypothetical protein
VRRRNFARDPGRPRRGGGRHGNVEEMRRGTAAWRGWCLACGYIALQLATLLDCS